MKIDKLNDKIKVACYKALGLVWKAVRATAYCYAYYQTLHFLPDQGFLSWVIISVGMFVGSVIVLEKK